MTVRVVHASVTHAAANAAALVDGPKWDADHTVTGLENVDNTSDLNKPVSSATQTAINAVVRSIVSFGAATTNTAAQNATAVQAALDTGLAIYVPPGTWSWNKVTASVSGTKLFGATSGLSILTSASANTAMIEVAAGVGNIEIFDLGLTRTVAATAGGTGINFLGYVDTSKVRDCEIQKQYVGVGLSATGYSYLSGCFIHDCLSDGVQLNNTAVYGTVQWYLHNNLVQGNAGRGIVVIASAGPAQVTLGDWIDNYTYANSSFGMAFAGLVGVPINGVRIKGGFVGGDGNSEIFLDTYGGQHKINGTFVELAGQGVTGPGFATAASHTGNGIEITANNTDVTITNVVANGNYLYGINTLATSMTNVVGCRFANNNLYGIVFGDGAKSAISGSTFSNNTSGTVLVSTNASSLVATGNSPNSINLYTATTNANSTGAITSVGNVTSLGSFTSANLSGALSDETGTGAAVFAGSPALTGTPTAPTAAVDTNTTQLATTAMVLAQAASATPLGPGTAAVGTSTRYARGDHVHPVPTQMGVMAVSLAAVNFNSANSDNAAVITLPTGFTRFEIDRVQVGHASGTLTTSTFGLFTTTGGGGTAIFALVSGAVSTASDATSGNVQNKLPDIAVTMVAASLPTANTIYFRIGTAQGSAATADVAVYYRPML